MGIFNSIIKNVVGDLTRDAQNTAAHKIANKVTEQIKSDVEKNDIKSSCKSDSIMINGINYSKEFNRNHDYFRNIIKTNFNGYTIEENVPVKRIREGASEAFKPISYLLSRDGKPVAAIAIIPAFRNASAKAAEICKENNIAYITFYCQYENTENYVVNRINDALTN